MTENDFNRDLTKGFSRLSPALHYLKASDKFSLGVADFLLWKNRTSVALECKHIATWPGAKANLLHHVFSGPQITFLESIALTGSRAYGLVSIGEDKAMYVFPWTEIPREGNWKTEQFRQRGAPGTWFHYQEIPQLVAWMFRENP